MEKLYVNEMKPNGEVSTVGLFYSRGEAENIVAQLRSIPEKADCHYEIVEAVAGFSIDQSTQTKGINRAVHPNCSPGGSQRQTQRSL